MENRRKIFPIVGKLAALLLLLAAPSARAWDGKGMPDPGEVVRYERLEPFDRTEREVAKEEGDGILELLRGWESFEDLRPKPADGATIGCIRWAPPTLVLSLFSESGRMANIEFRKSTDCGTVEPRLEVSFPGVGRLRVPDGTTRQLLALFDAWKAADLKAFRDAEPFPRRYVLESNRHDGGTLSGVARLFYGDGGKWPVIWDANKDAVPDPDRPKPGTSLKIPALAEGAAP